MGHGRVSAAAVLALASAFAGASPAAADLTGGAGPVVHTGGAAPGDVPPPLPPAGSRVATLVNGVARAPAGAPPKVRRVIAAGNKLQDKPYRYGGGHATFLDTGYDCSGTVSFALHGGRLLRAPLDSTGFETWGRAGRGGWITVYANAGHAYMVVAGLRLDTSGTNGRGPRWQTAPRPSTGFVVRHPARL
jgi:hypothetical protein